jgi:hypothetical protein
VGVFTSAPVRPRSRTNWGVPAPHQRASYRPLIDFAAERFEQNAGKHRREDRWHTRCSSADAQPAAGRFRGLEQAGCKSGSPRRRRRRKACALVGRKARNSFRSGQPGREAGPQSYGSLRDSRAAGRHRRGQGGTSVRGSPARPVPTPDPKQSRDLAPYTTHSRTCGQSIRTNQARRHSQPFRPLSSRYLGLRTLRL